MKKIKIKVALVTGAAGFVGSNLVDFLLKKKIKVIGIDNLKTGKKIFLENAFKNKNFTFFKVDLLSLKPFSKIFNKNIDIVYHLAANADVRFGLKNPRRDIDQNILCTFNVLEASKKNKIKNIVFSSTGSVYGEAETIPTKENASFPIQTSIYGASKLASEGLISAYCEGYNMRCWIFRFVSILGPRYTHGHVYDFYKKLMNNPNELFILGNGKQKKSYLHVYDCINAMHVAIKKKTRKKINIFNLGTDDYCQVNDSVKWISNILSLSPNLKYSGGKRGWIGDNPFIYLDTKKIRLLGWKPKFSIKKSVEDTVNYFLKNKWIFK